MNYCSPILPLTLSEAVKWLVAKVNVVWTEGELLALAFSAHPQKPLLPVYAVSHDFVMTVPLEHDPKFGSVPKGYKPLTEVEKRFAYRSYARGEMFRLHPDFVAKMAAVGTMNIADCAVHTITEAISPSRISGWKKIVREEQSSKYWTKIFESSITLTDDINSIALEDLRVDRNDLENYFQMPTPPISAASVEQAVANNVSLEPEIDSESWVVRVQTEATERIIRLRKSGANPTKNSIVEDLAKWCARTNIRTKTGINPSAETIRKHALRKWVLPK